MSVNSYLQSLGSDMVLSSAEEESIKKSLSAIKDRLTLYFSEDITAKIVFGSYMRGTILPRKADDNSDIDLMVVFKNPYFYKPQTFLNKLKNFAEYYYSRSEIYQSNPTIVLELNHIKFELVPAYVSYSDDWYNIPKTQSEWQLTNPTSFQNDLYECNKNNNYKIKPVIRLLKHWNIQNNKRDLASYVLEKKISENLKYAYFSCTSYTDYLQKSFETIKYSTNYTRVNTALEHISAALSYEAANCPYSALIEIMKVFPEV